MYHIHLTNVHQAELLRRTRLRSLSPATRTRLEMVHLSEAGWGVPRIAAHLHLHEQTVRHWIKAFLLGDFDALSNKPHLGKRATVSAATLAALADEIGKGERTWTSVQAQAWLFSKACRFNALRYAIIYDAWDYATSAPPAPCVTSKTLFIPYEAPQERRVNVIGAFFSHGDGAGRFLWNTFVSVPKSRGKTHPCPRRMEARVPSHGSTRQLLGSQKPPGAGRGGAVDRGGRDALLSARLLTAALGD